MLLLQEISAKVLGTHYYYMEWREEEEEEKGDFLDVTQWRGFVRATASQVTLNALH